MKQLLLLLVAAAAASAEVRLPDLFGDHMMLQADMPVRVWGTADPGEQIRVSFRGETWETTAGPDGRWQVFLPAGVAGGPFELQVNDRTIRDVLLGEVWVASGQSNMAFRLDRAARSAGDIATADFSGIRYYQVRRATGATPTEQLTGSWTVCTPATAKAYSAVAFYFARDLHGRRGFPVGIVEAAVGGSPAQAWTPREKLTGDPVLAPLLKVWEETKDKEKFTHWQPAGFFNGMIAPIQRFTIRGAIWYQGEHNGTRSQAGVYNRLFETMIRSWREAWGQGDFPFYFVQLPNFAKHGAGSQWPELREAQLRTLSLRNTGMAVTMDVGDPGDVHPTNKLPVGERLALLARAGVYHESVVSNGPSFERATLDGAAVALHFDHASGLKVIGPKGFEVAGDDGQFHAGEARVAGETVVVWSGAVKRPAQVRYAWGNDPPVGLTNSTGIPASPFRVTLTR